MGDVVIHAGMAKAGSTTIQRWLADHVDVLCERGVHVLVSSVDRDHADKPLMLGPADARSTNSGILFARYRLTDRAPSVLADFFSGVSDFADRHPATVISSESLAELLCEPDLVFLRSLEQLGRSHRVRVAYYVRPQHTAFEALWRHFGFREDVEPVHYLEQCAVRLDSLRTLQILREHAPSVQFEVRPFREDLLDGSNVACDFAGRFLAASDLWSARSETWENRGLPLELANALRFSPDGYFWNRAEYVFTRRNDAFQRMQRLFGDVEIAADARVHRSRLILQAHCHERFEPGNAALIAAFGWPTQWFVPPVDEDVGACWSIDELDALWRPTASANELTMLFHALKAAIDDRSSTGRSRRSAPRAPRGGARRAT